MASSVGSALIGAFGNILGSAISNAQSAYQQAQLMKTQAKLNYKYARLQSENNPSWSRTGLENAGYNPMLAVQNATSGANSSWSGLNSVQSADYSGAISQGVANAQSFQRLENETKTADSQANLADEQAKTEEDKRTNLQFDSMMKDAQKHLTDKETSWIDKKKNAEIYKDMQEAERARAEASVTAYNAETARIASNAQKLSAEASQQSANYGSWSRVAGFIGHTNALRKNGSPRALKRLRSMIGL